MVKPWRKGLSLNKALYDLPTPANLSVSWNFGSMLGLCLGIQVFTGLLLATRYVPEVTMAFDSVASIMRDVPHGWLIRNVHANGASVFFFLLYLHVGRGLYYGSYTKSATWLFGCLILVLSMAIAFMGYLLPWGQMSFWGATVITNLFSAIPYWGPTLTEWMWGGYSVGAATLTRFYVGHFLFPMVLIVLVMFHLLSLHTTGSSNPLGVSSRILNVPFHPAYTAKDMVGFILLTGVLGGLALFAPNMLGDPENFIPANPLITPTHIKPEWYFLWAYAILRSIPNKLGGVLAMFSAILVFFLAPLFVGPRQGVSSSVLRQLIFWSFCSVVLGLTWIGGSPVETPYIVLGQVFTALYFLLYALFLISGLF